MAGRPERPRDPRASPVARFGADLNTLRHEAKLTYRGLSERCYVNHATLNRATSGKKLPSLETTRAFVQGCGGDVERWTERWYDTQRQAAEFESGGILDPVTPPAPAPPHTQEEGSPTDTPATAPAPTAATGAEADPGGSAPNGAAAPEQPRPDRPPGSAPDEPRIGSILPIPTAVPAQLPQSVHTARALAIQLRRLATRASDAGKPVRFLVDASATGELGSLTPDESAILIRILLFEVPPTQLATPLRLSTETIKAIAAEPPTKQQWRAGRGAVQNFALAAGEEFSDAFDWCEAYQRLRSWTPDPTAIRTLADLRQVMATAKNHVFLSFSGVANASQGAFSRSTAHTLVAGDTLPRRDQVHAFLTACGISVDATWHRAIDRALAPPQVDSDSHLTDDDLLGDLADATTEDLGRSVDSQPVPPPNDPITRAIALATLPTRNPPLATARPPSRRRPLTAGRVLTVVAVLAAWMALWVTSALAYGTYVAGVLYMWLSIGIGAFAWLLIGGTAVLAGLAVERIVYRRHLSELDQAGFLVNAPIAAALLWAPGALTWSVLVHGFSWEVVITGVVITVITRLVVASVE